MSSEPQCVARICSLNERGQTGLDRALLGKVETRLGSRHSDPFRQTRSRFLEKLISKMRRIVGAQQTAELLPYLSIKAVASNWNNRDSGGLDFDMKEAEAHVGLGVKRGRFAEVQRIHSECKRGESYNKRDAWSEDRMLGRLGPGAMGGEMIGGFAPVPAGSP